MILTRQGCDGSVLLDGTPFSESEKDATPNANSLRGFDVIDDIKSYVERACPATVSCADILALASRDAVALLGGPTWKVQLGRKDSRGTNRTGAEYGLPAPNSTLAELIDLFKQYDLDARDMAALSARTPSARRGATTTGTESTATTARAAPTSIPRLRSCAGRRASPLMTRRRRSTSRPR